MTVEAHKQLDLADAECKSIKKIFDLGSSGSDYEARKKTASNYRKTIEEVVSTVTNANNIIQENLPEEKKKSMMDRVGDIQERTSVLDKTDEKLDFIDDFNKRLAIFNASVSELEGWLTSARERVDNIVSPESAFSPEDRVTKTMEFQEDLRKKIEFLIAQQNVKEDIFPKSDEKIPSDAKTFLGELEKIHNAIYAMEDEVKAECAKFSEDVKFWAEFHTGVKEFEPWIKLAEKRKCKGLDKPTTLIEACEILGDSKNFQDECEKKLKVLEEAATSAKKMSCHNEADVKVSELKGRWDKVHETAMEWVSRMTELVECWNKLEGNVDELSSWVNVEDASKKDVLGNDNHISIEKLEGQLNQLKSMFAEKQKLVNELEACGPSEPESNEISEMHISTSE